MVNLRKMREKKGITQINLSSNIGVAQETISAYESGKALPSIDTLIRIVDYLGTSTDYILDRTDVPSPVKDLIIGNLNSEEAYN